MNKIKENKGVFIIGIIIFSLLFYWFQIRPTSIKKECSWSIEVIEADPGVTEAQAKENKESFEECSAKKSSGRVTSFNCYLLGENSTARAPQPERTEINVATDDEYRTCLRQNGL